MWGEADIHIGVGGRVRKRAQFNGISNPTRGLKILQSHGLILGLFQLVMIVMEKINQGDGSQKMLG